MIRLIVRIFRWILFMPSEEERRRIEWEQTTTALQADIDAHTRAIDELEDE